MMTPQERAAIRAAARRAVADWPPLTPEQRALLAAIFAAAIKRQQKAA